MDRLARLMPFRTFGRLRHLRSVTPCPPLEAAAVGSTRQTQDNLLAGTQPAALPAFARVSLNSALHAEPARRAPVRVYHGPSRVILVGTIDAVCKMIDRCIDDERAGAPAVQCG
jgi:hypothetical protein